MTSFLKFLTIGFEVLQMRVFKIKIISCILDVPVPGYRSFYSTRRAKRAGCIPNLTGLMSAILEC